MSSHVVSTPVAMSSLPLSDPFLQVMSMSPKVSTLANSAGKKTSSLSAPPLLPVLEPAQHQDFVPQKQTMGFAAPKQEAAFAGRVSDLGAEAK